jgi:glycosyltransferase involved in cell wall biosynthesis
VLTVAMPYWRCADTVERAARSVLDQTHRDLRLVVVGDGEPVPLAIRDPRLTILNLPEIRGPYYASAVVLAACETPWFTIHDADDWSDPDRYAGLLAASDGYDAVFGGVMQHQDGRVWPKPVHLSRPMSKVLRHTINHVAGIYRTDALRSVGGPHPEYRLVYDSMMVGLILRALRWRLVDERSYHRDHRPDSLTRHPDTHYGSPIRIEARTRRDSLWRRVIRRPVSEWPELLRPSPRIAAQIAEDAARLGLAVAA